MGKTVYIECHAGISGDMTVAALLDLGADREKLQKVLDSIPEKGFQVKYSRVKKSGIDCMDFAVELSEEYENHDHDMEYLHGHDVTSEQHSHHEKTLHEHKHDHEHSHGHYHTHVHRRLQDVLQILDKTTMTDGAKTLAKKIFKILAEAEAKAHGLSLEEVHFHEVGAMDSIVDVIAASVCIDDLEISEVVVPSVCEGCGTIRCAHGILPIPVPAVANILEKYQIPVEFMNISGEFVTPTGAAILAAIMTSNHLAPGLKIQKIGMGAGKRTYERPSILRMMLVESGAEEQDLIYKLETNIDDCTGEALGFLMERLLKAGAKDVYYLPIYMKKNRPAWQVSVLCRKEDIKTLEQLIFLETTTIGIRRISYERTVLPRWGEIRQTKYGDIQGKVCQIGDMERYYPEYESVIEKCREYGVSYQEVYQEAMMGLAKSKKHGMMDK